MAQEGNRKATIEEVRSGLISRFGANEGMWAAVCGCIGLACVFSGIWLGDTQAHAILDASNSVLVMRVFTSVIYLGFLLFVIFFVQKKGLSLRSFFAASAVITYGLFLLGIVPVMYFSLHGVRLYGGDWSWVALFLTKLIGAPLTVGLVCVFAQLRRKLALRFTALGMFGSFLIYSAVSQLIGTDGTSFTVCAISALLLFVCTAALILGLGPHSSNEEIRTTQSVVGSGVIRRPIKQMLTPGLVIMLLISSVMLGYLRSGYVADSASYQEASVVVLALLFVIPALWQNVRIEHVFFAGLILATGSILLNPYLGSLSPAVAPVMGGVGTALFEVVVWTLAVWGAHNCTESLLMASASRFVITVGHLLGSQIMAFGVSSMPSLTEGENAAGAIIVFAFLLLLILLLKNPNLRAPFTAHVSTYESYGSFGSDDASGIDGVKSASGVSGVKGPDGAPSFGSALERGKAKLEPAINFGDSSVAADGLLHGIGADGLPHGESASHAMSADGMSHGVSVGSASYGASTPYDMSAYSSALGGEGGLAASTSNGDVVVGTQGGGCSANPCSGCSVYGGAAGSADAILSSAAAYGNTAFGNTESGNAGGTANTGAAFGNAAASAGTNVAANASFGNAGVSAGASVGADAVSVNAGTAVGINNADNYATVNTNAAATTDAGSAVNSGSVNADVSSGNADAANLTGAEASAATESSMTPEEEYEYRYWKHPCQIIVDTYRLTKRESEVLELLARGYTVATMSEALYVSPNTTKMHVRNIYTKLDVHGKQDVISMVELVRQQIAKEKI